MTFACFNCGIVKQSLHLALNIFLWHKIAQKESVWDRNFSAALWTDVKKRFPQGAGNGPAAANEIFKMLMEEAARR